MKPLILDERSPDPAAPTTTVGLGELVAAAAPGCLVTYGLGSCVGLCVYDPLRRVGGLAHIFLPWGDTDREGQPALYANKGVERLVRAVAELGGDLRRLQAKMVGGARLFAHSDTLNIGERNVGAVRAELQRLMIPLAGEEVGGNRGRSVLFDLSSGRLRITSGGREIRWL
ncbi:MAG TPA: chemotaxis protein CheD [Limnochorda sp.]